MNRERREYKSQEYLNFLGEKSCVVTGSRRGVDLHHEALLPEFSGRKKNKFDFCALPLKKEIHLYERHRTGKDEFWESYALDPLELAKEMVREYIDTWPDDVELAEEALELLESVR